MAAGCSLLGCLRLASCGASAPPCLTSAGVAASPRRFPRWGARRVRARVVLCCVVKLCDAARVTRLRPLLPARSVAAPRGTHGLQRFTSTPPKCTRSLLYTTMRSRGALHRDGPARPNLLVESAHIQPKNRVGSPPHTHRLQLLRVRRRLVRSIPRPKRQPPAARGVLLPRGGVRTRAHRHAPRCGHAVRVQASHGLARDTCAPISRARGRRHPRFAHRWYVPREVCAALAARHSSSRREPELATHIVRKRARRKSRARRLGIEVAQFCRMEAAG